MLNQHAVMLIPLVSNGRKVIIGLASVIMYLSVCNSVTINTEQRMLRMNNYFGWYVCGFWLAARLIL